MGYDDGLLDRPVRFGTGFQKPSAKTLRLESAKRGALDLRADELRKLIEKADVIVKAMIYLGVNCGQGNNDVATLPKAAVDLEAGWLDFPRPKTGVPRRAKLWPETVAALRAAIAVRPNPKSEEDADLIFVTRLGNRWAKDAAGNNPVSMMFKRLLKECGLHRKGVGFYSLRRTFETVAGGTADQVAVDHVMGHAPHVSDMGARYRQRIDDTRLDRVAKHVRIWMLTTGNAVSRRPRSK